MSGIPLQSSCDPEVPDEHCLWALVGLAGPTSHAPLILPQEVQRQWSKHLWDCGFRHNPELQTIRYVPPPRNTNWLQGAAGRWVDINTTLSAEQSAPDVSHLSDSEQLVIMRRLMEKFGAGEGSDDSA